MSIGPRADFLCEKCEASGKMTEPVELPLASAHCPICGRKKWLRRMWSGFRVNVSGTKLTPTMHGTEANGRDTINAINAMGPDWDAQRDAQRRAREAMMRDPYAPKLVGPNQLSTVVPGVPLSMGAMSDQPSRPLPMPRGQTILADGMRGPSKMAATNIVARVQGDGKG